MKGNKNSQKNNYNKIGIKEEILKEFKPQTMRQIMNQNNFSLIKTLKLIQQKVVQRFLILLIQILLLVVCVDTLILKQNLFKILNNYNK